MASADPEETFKVTDRRRLEEADPVADAAPKAEPKAEPRSPAVPPPTTEPQPPGERVLTGLFIMLASSAVMALGDAPDPMTGQVHRDLDQAADLIDLLLLLREKTEGHRTLEETQVLDEIIYDLQLRFVAATKRS